MQAGQLWVTACMLSTQKGIRQQGQIPNTHRAPHRIQAMALLSDLVLGVRGIIGESSVHGCIFFY